MVYLAEYIWIGGNNELRSKTRVLNDDIDFNDLPIWNYDGSSTNQATGENSEVYIKPCSVFQDPFRKNNNILVMCDTYLNDGITPHPTNTRYIAKEIFNRGSIKDDPWFGMEQEYFLFNPETKLPLGFPKNGFPEPQGQYYCSVGGSNSHGRNIAEEHLQACLFAGINITGINLEVACGQLEFQILGKGLTAGDQLWIARYILERIAEKYSLDVNYHPKPLLHDWNGSGCHINFSTKYMRENDNGLEIIYECMKKLEIKHREHLEVYGKYNHLRLTGKHETSSMAKFTFAKADRGASVRIPSQTIKDGKGYFEDRRPASNVDPWLATSKIYETCCL